MRVLIIGVRRKCYQAALALGHEVYLWSDGPLQEARKKKLKAWLEIPYVDCAHDLTDAVKAFLQQHSIERVIANTEEVVVLGSRVRRFLGLKSLAIDITERFHNKFVMKNCARDGGIPITRYTLIEAHTQAEDIAAQLGFPIVVKPVDESGARGVVVFHTVEELKQNMKIGWLAESFVEGSEASVETLIRDGQPVFHNVTEYLHQWKKSVVPAQYSEATRQKIIELNDRVIEHFGVDRGMTHAEFYVTNKGPIFGEIALRPPGGYYMDLIEQVYGFDPWNAYIKVSCMEDPGPLNGKALRHAAVLMFHPGAGRIKSIVGEPEVRQQLRNIVEFRIRKKAGDRVEEHSNTSAEVGHLIFWESSRLELMRNIEFVEATLKITLE